MWFGWTQGWINQALVILCDFGSWHQCLKFTLLKSPRCRCSPLCGVVLLFAFVFRSKPFIAPIHLLCSLHAYLRVFGLSRQCSVLFFRLFLLPLNCNCSKSQTLSQIPVGNDNRLRTQYLVWRLGKNDTLTSTSHVTQIRATSLLSRAISAENGGAKFGFLAFCVGISLFERRLLNIQ